MSDFTSPSAIRAGVDALEQNYERFVAITRERLEAVYPAAATGLDQLYDMRRRTIDGVLSAGKTAAHGWDDLSAMLAANHEAMMEGFRAMTQSWFGGGALGAVEEKFAEMQKTMMGQIEAMEKGAAELLEEQSRAFKAASDGFAAELETARTATQGAASEAAAAKSEAVEAKSEAVSATEAITALGAEMEQKIAALRGALDSEVAAAVESQIDAARKEIERETDEDVDDKLAVVREAFDAKLAKIENTLAADLAKLRNELAGLAKAAAAKPAAAKRPTPKAAKKPRA
jgi:hypothetical protein